MNLADVELGNKLSGCEPLSSTKPIAQSTWKKVYRRSSNNSHSRSPSASVETRKRILEEQESLRLKKQRKMILVDNIEMDSGLAEVGIGQSRHAL